jgi:hypothetical protein
LNVPILQLPERTGSLRLAMRYLARVWLGDAEGYFPILDSDVWDAPGVTRAAVLRDAALAASIGQFGAIQAVAPSVGVEVSPINIRDAGEIERAVAAFARSGNGGLIVTGSALAQLHRNLIITLAARQAARSVLRAVLCDGRRPDFLRA